ALDAAAVPPGTARVLTFFGMIPNFEPSVILPKLASLTRPGDLLLFSANLAPGSDYVAGIKKVLPLYDNALTREWLMTVLLDAGVERDAGRVEFRIEPDPSGGPLMRIAARFIFVRESGVRIGEEEFKFRPGEEFQLFFSYRHTPALIGEMLAQHGLSTPKHWVNQSGEEGVFLVLKTR
ncbi:MAG TPA: L-histidine N(alpha)-methyltransferase, partial [Verrucomicrobiae bacterium]|nr:L-histidine N(alpha)-methyltransferase [Verrucomicrobiae bacterium]